MVYGKKIALERTTDQEEEEIQSYFQRECMTELTEETITQHIEEGFAKIMKSFEEFIQRGSGWNLKKIQHLELRIAKYHLLAATSYIALPQKLYDKKAVLNIKKDDIKCLIWCLLAFKLNLPREKKPKRVCHYIPF